MKAWIEVQRIQLRDAMRNFGASEVLAFAGVVALAVSCFALFIVYTRPDVPIVGTPPATEETNIIVPQSPGLQSAQTVCEDGAITSGEFEVLPVPPEPVYKYVAELGPDLLSWVDSGNNRVALLNGQAIVLDDEVIECFRDSR